MYSKKTVKKRENILVRFLTLVKKELNVLASDKQAIAIVFILPIVALAAIGVTGGFSDDPFEMLTAGRPVILGFVNTDQSLGEPNYVLADEFGYVLGEEPGVTLVNYSNLPLEERRAQAENDLYYERIKGYIWIGDGFEFNVSGHVIPGRIYMFADAIDITAEPLILKRLNDAINQFKNQFNYTEDEIDVNTDALWNIESPLFISLPMVMTITIVASGLMLATQSIVGDNPLNRVALTPASKLEIVSSKVCAYTMLHMIQSTIILVFPMIFFNMRYPPSTFSHFLAVWGSQVFISYASVCLGVFLSTLAKTKLQGSQFFLLGFMVLFILGGQMFEVVPGLSELLPMEHNSQMFMKLAYKNLSIGALLPHIWPQLVFGTIFFIAAYVVLRLKREAI